MGGPSNWQGPVWGIATFLPAYGLARYGFKKEAADVAGRLLDVFCADQQQNGTIHECYHAETGAPIMKPGFLSWNLLAIRIMNDLDTAGDPAWIAGE
jgi:putative isomerase